MPTEFLTGLAALAVLALATTIPWLVKRSRRSVERRCLSTLEGKKVGLTAREVWAQIVMPRDAPATSLPEVRKALDRLAKTGLISCRREEGKLPLKLYSKKSVRSLPRRVGIPATYRLIRKA